MLKKLKRKFIFINMFLIGIVVITVFSAVCGITYRTRKNEIEKSLEQAALVAMRNLPRTERGETEKDKSQKGTIETVGQPDETTVGTQPELPKIGGDGKAPYISAFTVLVDSDGNISGSFGYGTDMDEAVLSEAVTKALAADGERGTLDGLGLLYLRLATKDGYCVSFTSTEPLTLAMRNAVLISGAACLISLLVFLFVSSILAEIAIKPAAEAWRREKQFVADASHDLKTPVTVILANTGILLSHREEPVGSQTKWLESTKEEAERMRGLADRMLELARSEDGRERLTFGETAVSDITEQSILQLEPVAFERQVSIVGAVTPNLMIRSHGESFARLVQILLDNAVKYSPPGGEVRVGLVPCKPGVRLTVQNGGEPIPPEDLPHIFERFYRADKAREVGGHGLGLAIAKNLTENLGGKITVESTAAGTTFTVTL